MIKLVITSIERSKKNKERLLVYIDNEFSFSVSEEDYLTLNLYDKKEVSVEDIDYIKNNLNFRTAKSKAVRFLAAKIRSGKEVEIKLSDEGYDFQTIENVIIELKAIGYINDEMYAQKYIFDRSKLKPKSKRLLKMELMNKGISEEIADEALDNWQMDEGAVAESLVKRKFGKYDLNDQKVVKKVYAFLQHRGFNYRQIEEVISKLV